MTRMLTRPIPNIALETLNDRFVEARREVELAEIGRSSLDTRREVAEKVFAAVRGSSRDVPGWRLMQDALAAAAITFLGQHAAFLDTPSSAGEFLVVLNDRGVTRPIVGIDEVQGRAGASMQPMLLSEEDAALLQRLLKSGTARPRIDVAELPQYGG